MADANTDIILAAGDLNNPMRYLSLAKMAQDVQSQQRAVAGQNALRQLFSDPNALDPQGNLTPQAQAKVMQIDPATGMEFRKSALDDQVRRAQQQHEQTETGKIKFQAMGTIASVGVDAYNEAKKQGKSEQEALAAGAAARNEAAKANGGMLGEQDITGIISQPFDPMKAEALARTNPEWVKQRGETEKERHDVATEQLGEEREDRLIAAVGSKPKAGWELFTKPDGSVIRVNKDTGETAALGDDTKGISKVGSSGGGGFTPEMGDLMAAMAEVGVSIPAGMRSKAQQIKTLQGLLDRHPKNTPDEIADMIKTGQIELGAQKKETQTAAGIAGKVQVFANELDKNIPLLREASKAVPRGEWTDLNKLIQTGDTHISDPKLKTLKGYIVSTLNAYDALAARGGTDKDKREINRQLLLGSDGPEAFEAQLKVFENEARIAKDSAFEATKAPELPDTGKDIGKKVDHSKMTDDELKKKLGIQ